MEILEYMIQLISSSSIHIHKICRKENFTLPLVYYIANHTAFHKALVYSSNDGVGESAIATNRIFKYIILVLNSVSSL